MLVVHYNGPLVVILDIDFVLLEGGLKDPKGSPALIVHNNYYSLGFTYSKKSGPVGVNRGDKLVLTIASGGITLW